MTTFDALRAPVRPADPDRRFVDRLRAEIAAALAAGSTSEITLPPIPLPERSTPMSQTTGQTNSPTSSPGDHPTAATSLVPYLAVRGAAAAIDWYRHVFAARETVRYTADDDGTIGHAELDIDGVRLYLSDEYPDFDAVSPEMLGGTPVALNLVVPDVDAVFERAVARGAVVRREPADQAYGERSCTFIDPWGHRWMVQTTIATPTVDEINATMDGFTVSAPDEEG